MDIINDKFAAALRRINDVLVDIPVLSIDCELKKVTVVTKNVLHEEVKTFADPIETRVLLRNIKDRRLLRKLGLYNSDDGKSEKTETLLAHFSYVDDVTKGAKFRTKRHDPNGEDFWEYYTVKDIIANNRKHEVKRTYVVDFDPNPVDHWGDDT